MKLALELFLFELQVWDTWKELVCEELVISDDAKIWRLSRWWLGMLKFILFILKFFLFHLGRSTQVLLLLIENLFILKVSFVSKILIFIWRFCLFFSFFLSKELSFELRRVSFLLLFLFCLFVLFFFCFLRRFHTRIYI